MTPDSISFDNAASFYDKTRSLSPDAAAAVTETLRRELEGRGRALEVGVGTGRIALPLAAAGIDMTGVDLARNMLARLVENAGDQIPFPLIQGDATRLPFRDGSYGGAIASWVLHLVSAWRDVLSEMVRVVGAGGVLLIDVGSEHESIIHKVTWKFRDLANVTDWPRGTASFRDVDAVLDELGARSRSLDPIVEITETALEEHISLLERGVFSVTWSLDDMARSRAANELRTWTKQEFGSLDEVRRIETSMTWRAYDL